MAQHGRLLRQPSKWAGGGQLCVLCGLQSGPIGVRGAQRNRHCCQTCLLDAFKYNVLALSLQNELYFLLQHLLQAVALLCLVRLSGISLTTHKL